METIKRIAPTSRRSSRPRKGEENVPARPKGELVTTGDVKRARGATANNGETAGSRPTAPFLAQYVDQNYAWPRAPFRKEGERRRAANAYAEADKLPDILAEALRLRPDERKL